AAREIDASGRFIAPGFIDAHLHIEYTAATPGQLARVSVPRGTTTVLADPGGLGVIAGRRGVELMGRTTTPLRIFQQITSQIPGSPLQPAPGTLAQADHLDLLGRSTS